MISIALERLVDRGFVDPVALSIHARAGASLGAMRRELSVAQAKLAARIGFVPRMSGQADETRMQRWDSVSQDPNALALLESVHRVNAARRVLAALLEPASGADSLVRRLTPNARHTEATLHHHALAEWADDGGKTG